MDGNNDSCGQPDDVVNPRRGRRLVSVKVACKYGGFAQTKCYALINQGRIRAYKLDTKTLIDLDSIDELHASLPQIGRRAEKK